MTTLIEIRHPLDGSQFSSEQLTARYEDEIASMSGHLAALESFVLPVARRRLSGTGLGAIDLRVQAHHLKRVLRRMEGRLRGGPRTGRSSTHDLHASMVKEFDALVAGEQEMVGHLNAQLDPVRRDRLVSVLARTSLRAPTRPHPHVPHIRGLSALAYRVCARLDRVLDTVDGRALHRRSPAASAAPAQAGFPVPVSASSDGGS